MSKLRFFTPLLALFLSNSVLAGSVTGYINAPESGAGETLEITWTNDQGEWFSINDLGLHPELLPEGWYIDFGSADNATERL